MNQGDHWPTPNAIIVDDELMELDRCPACGAFAVKRNTPSGWVRHCLNSCDGQGIVLTGPLVEGNDNDESNV